MRARDLAEPYPAVSADDDAVTAARLFVERRLPALLVLDTDQRPYAIVPGSQLLRVVLPDYVLEDSAQALALDSELGSWRDSPSPSGCRAAAPCRPSSGRIRVSHRSPR
ncbi:hypothetical protein PV963_20765 [Streptomyces coeruleorubidus]|uniref:hypothetical protein n=1 Tax=Streptomyces coeruleorubidus TaxID=116188 RepID=UPI00237F08C1|nr:hypothetical protein [Streptomyces coeruleorubidus]WDV52633.1 hypothetical protein PV963_20765 [Streptomyces coeruleorubidus]